MCFFDKIRAKRSPFFSNVTKRPEFVMVRVVQALFPEGS